MELEDAFMQEEINRAGTDLDDQLMAELKELITNTWTGNNVDHEDSHLDLATLCFVAGRTYQHDLDTVQVALTPPLIQAFMEFIVRGGS